MDNPWATPWDDQHTSWPADNWPQNVHGDAPWEPSTISHFQDTTSGQNLVPQDERAVSHLPASDAPDTHSDSVSDHHTARSASPPGDPPDPVPETADAILHNVASVTSVSDKDDLGTALCHTEDDWNTAWATTSSSDTNHEGTRPPDQWETALQEKGKLNRAVPPESLDSILHHCQRVSQEVWPSSSPKDEDSWRSRSNNHPDVAVLLAQLIPVDSTLPPTVPFSTTATAKAMNDALRLTRNLPASASSPLSRLSASKGSLDWEKSIKAAQDIVPDTGHVGWRVVEKEGRMSTLAEESKQWKAVGGLLSFWNRRASAIQSTPAETTRQRSNSPARSSSESVKSVPNPPSARAASPPNASTPSVLPPPPADSHSAVVATASTPSAVSRFLNRFSRVKGAQHSSLALSSDDLEFLSDIVPSASDPPDEDINDSTLDALTRASDSSPLPPKLPPPIPPPPRQSTLSSRPSSVLGLGAMAGIRNTSTAFQIQTASHTPNVPVLAPPLSPKPVTSPSCTQSPALSLRDVATETVASGQSSAQQRFQSNSQSNSQSHISFTLPSPLPPPQKPPPSLSIPSNLPPPSVSPPQTPRLNSFPSGCSPTIWNAGVSSSYDSYDSDEEFSAFASFPPPAAAPSPSSESYTSQRPPSPPSPPPRRTHERTHYPSSSSTSSILSPASQTSLDQLCSTGSSVPVPLDNFDDFVSPAPVVRGESRRRTPSPPPLPVKPQFQHQHPPHHDTFTSRSNHAHTSSQTYASPTVHTSLMSSTFSVPSKEHQRTQSLVDHAAARGGLLWPNSPDLGEPRVKAIPPPPSSASPKPPIREEGPDLLGDGDVLNSGLEALPAPLSSARDIGMRTMVSPLAVDGLHSPFGVAGGPGKGSSLRNQLQPSPPPLPSISKPVLSFSPLGNPNPLTATVLRPSQPAKPKQTGGLSEQDLSFFEGL